MTPRPTNASRLAASIEADHAQALALDTFVPGVRVDVDGLGAGTIYTAPVVGATGRVSFGVRLDSGAAKIANEDNTRRLA